MTKQELNVYNILLGEIAIADYGNRGNRIYTLERFIEVIGNRINFGIDNIDEDDV
jgi:hypothetical protein